MQSKPTKKNKDLFNLLGSEEEQPLDLTLLYEIRDALIEASEYGCDIESTGFSMEDDKITMISFATKKRGWALRTKDFPLEVINTVMKPVFEDSNKIVVFHFANFDVKFLNSVGVFFQNKIHDTMILAWLYDEDRIRYGSYGLKECVLKELNYQMATFQESTGLFGDMDQYSADDSFQTIRLYNFYKEKLIIAGVWDWYINVEHKVTEVILEMETRGVALDKYQLKTLKEEAFIQLDVIMKDLYKLAGYEFDISSSQQTGKLLFDELKLGMVEGGTNKYSFKNELSKEWSTKNEVLESMHRDGVAIASRLLDFREINTRLNVFIKPLYERCRVSTIIYPRFIQTGTVSGRLSSKDPNYQNLPRKGGVRKAFVRRAGYKILRADYSQAELRLMAHMSNDPVMLEIYRNGGDIHQITATACGVTRQAAKAINFGLIYRMSGARLQGQLAIDGIIITMEEAQTYVKKYFEKYRKVREYHRRVENTVKNRLEENGSYGWIRTLGGRLRRLDREFLENPETNYTSITQAINTTIQGGVSDLIKVAMVDMQTEFKKRGWLNPSLGIWDVYLQGQVHDEVFVECKEEYVEEASKIVELCMVNAGIKYKIKVPMISEVMAVDHLGKG